MGRPRLDPETTPTKKLVLTLTDDGSSINWDRLRVSTREQFISALKQSEEVMSALDRPVERSDAPAPGADPAFSQETVRVALDLLGTINAFALRLGVAKAVKHPFKVDADTGAKLPLVIDADIASKAFQLTPEQHAELDPRLEKKLNELKLPGFLEKNLDWYLIGATYLKYCGENAKRAIGAQVMRDFKLQQDAIARAMINKNPRPDSDARRASNYENGHAGQTPTEFATEETETFPPGDMPSA